MSDDARRSILARRARFVAAAMASLAAASCDKAPPHPCLSATATRVDGQAPMPCLDLPILATDAGAEIAMDDAGAADAGDAGRDAGKRIVGPPRPPPMPCLSAPPQVCLTPPSQQPCLSSPEF